MQPKMFSSWDALPCHWNPTSMAERVGLPPCNGSPTLNTLPQRFSAPHISPVYRRHFKQLERFHQRAIRPILGIRWQDRVTNTEVFERTNCISIEAMLLKSCLRWTGHVISMKDHRIPKQQLFGELEQGHRRQGRPCKRFKDTVKAGLQWCGIPPFHQLNWLLLLWTDSAGAHLYTICVICARGRASPPSTVRQRTPPLGSLCPSDKCELPVPRLRTALQVQDRPAEPLPYPQIRGTGNVILETEGPP